MSGRTPRVQCDTLLGGAGSLPSRHPAESQAPASEWFHGLARQDDGLSYEQTGTQTKLNHTRGCSESETFALSMLE